MRHAGPRSYGGWSETAIFAQLEGIHVAVYTRDTTARKSPWYKARKARVLIATKKVMLEWGETPSGQPHF